MSSGKIGMTMTYRNVQPVQRQAQQIQAQQIQAQQIQAQQTLQNKVRIQPRLNIIPMNRITHMTNIIHKPAGSCSSCGN